jgi:CPA1 family monovalent cation:H+ antiporter
LLSAVFSKSTHRIEGRHQHILFWGGLKGALGLALAYGLPTTLENREEVIAVAFGVVAFSVLVQGLTMLPLLRKLDLLPQQTGVA